MTLRSAPSRPAAIVVALVLFALTATMLTAFPIAASAATPGSLTWGVKESFRSYLATGGTATASSGATDNGTATTFPASNANIVDGAGEVNYAGSVTFAYPSHGLDITLSNVSITLDGSSTATLSAEHAGVRQSLASLDLTSGSQTVADGVTTYSGVSSVALAGTPAIFGNYYPVGSALAPVTFSYATPAVDPDPEPTSPDPEPTETETPDPEPTETETPDPEPTSPDPTTPDYGITVNSVVADGDSAVVTFSGTFPATVNEVNTGIYALWCTEGYDRSRSTGCASTRDAGGWFAHTSQYATIVGSVAHGVWSFTDVQVTVPNTVGDTQCKGADGDAECGLLFRLDRYNNSDTSFDQFESVPFPDTTPPAVPQITVSETENLDGSGQTVTITGTGFDFEADGAPVGSRPPLAGLSTGAYVVFGKFADQWQPTSGAQSTARLVAEDQDRWALPAAYLSTGSDNPVPPMFQAALRADGVAVDANGDFELTLEVSDFAPDADGNYGIYTYAASGAKYAPYETATLLSFRDDAPEPASGNLTWAISESFNAYVTGPVGQGSITASAGATDKPERFTFTADGGNADVTLGKGTAQFRGTVAYSAHHGQLTLSIENPFIRVTSPNSAVLSVMTGGQRIDFANLNLGAAARVAGTNAATFSDVPATLTSDGAAVLRSTAGSAIAPLTVTLGASAPTDGDGDGSDGGSTPGNGSGTGTPGNGNGGTVVAVDEPTSTQTAATVGRLTWGISSGFRNYVTGPIAQGQVSVTGASAGGSTFTFVQSAGTPNVAGGTGSATYGGSVRFSGHHGALDYTFANPRVTLTSSTTAVLNVAVNGTRMNFATLNLASGTRSELNGAVRFSNVPATLTSAGASVLSFGGNSLGVDPVTVTFGAAASGATGSSTARVVQSAFTTHTDTDIPDTPPATTGIELDAETLEALLRGEVVTIQVGGFQPNEEGISVVVYSTPTVLASDLTADATGTVTWTGSLPSTLTGQHTLTFQGSVDKGIVLDIPDASLEGMCVADAELAWGFKSGFRAYVESTTANGEWELEGVTEEDGIFTWATGQAVLDPEDSTGAVSTEGSVRFTGHGGALDTTIANPTVELSADGAYLLLDVSGTTQSGEDVTQDAIRFAELDLESATVTTDGNTTTVSDIPAALTEAGAVAFGTYPTGEELDTITVTLTGADDCAAVLGGAQIAVAEPSPSPTPKAESDDPAATAETSSEGGSFWWIWVLAALAIAGAATAVIVGARRKA
ncbi:HtaA domain-containing protein [Demequina sediminicola]|uniref:HtaA domain-containing protein n=1 Tax=Demequina sediminicola TaxID=1095026 RepID=UPI0007843D05|nr:HtaA domain-containing protein [Demequina sediminicola]